MLGPMSAAVVELARRAKVASRRLGTASTDEKNAALLDAADLLLARTAEILDANVVDLAAAEADGMAPSALDRLRLNDARLAAMAGGLRQVASLPDPVGETLDGTRRPNGLVIQRIRVPLGVVAVIYENRPNVTSDAAGHLSQVGQRGPAARLEHRPRAPTGRWPRRCARASIKARAPRRRRGSSSTTSRHEAAVWP